MTRTKKKTGTLEGGRSVASSAVVSGGGSGEGRGLLLLRGGGGGQRRRQRCWKNFFVFCFSFFVRWIFDCDFVVLFLCLLSLCFLLESYRGGVEEARVVLCTARCRG